MHGFRLFLFTLAVFIVGFSAAHVLGDPKHKKDDLLITCYAGIDAGPYLEDVRVEIVGYPDCNCITDGIGRCNLYLPMHIKKPKYVMSKPGYHTTKPVSVSIESQSIEDVLMPIK